MRSRLAGSPQRLLTTSVTVLALAGSGVGISACTSVDPKPPAKTSAIGANPLPPLRGFGFSPFRDCQSPERKVFPTMAQMREDVDIIRTMGNAVRTYSSLNGAEQVVRSAHQLGLRVSAGASLGPETSSAGRTANQNEIKALLSLAKNTPVESVIVGNEVLLRGDLSPHRLAEYIRQVKRELPNVTVTTAEIAGIATQPENREVIDAADALMAHVYPYWDGVGIDDAAWYVADALARTEAAVQKPVIIGETGWPSAGPTKGKAVPNAANASRFLSEWAAVAAHENISYYYFAAFDEPWKTEGGVGAHWGVRDVSRHAKYPFRSLTTGLGPVPPRRSVASPAASSSPPSDTASSRDDIVTIYETWPPATNYVPSGFMGDDQDVAVDECASGGRDTASAADHAIRVDYRPSGGQGWAGVYWQNPADNWGDQAGGHDLRGLTALTFYAKGARGNEKLRFFSGGISGEYGDTLAKRTIAVTLGTGWQKYSIDLQGGDLSRVVGAFGWAANRADNPSGASFYLDDIRLDGTRLSTAPPAAPPVVQQTRLNTRYLAKRRPCTNTPAKTLYILDGNTLCAGRSPVGRYEIGVDTSGRQRKWLSSANGALKMSYPRGQQWGAVFITVGAPVPPGSRPGQNLSRCHTLQVDLRSDSPKASLSIGMKDKYQPDDGRETKIRVRPTRTWKTSSFRLTRFTGTKMSAVYIPIEFVFEKNDPAQVVYFRNVRFLCK